MAPELKDIVAVFSFTFQDVALKKQADLLAEYLRNQLTINGKFVVVPDSQVRQALASLQNESHLDCRDDACRIELGRAVSAAKYVSPTVFRSGPTCEIMATLYDVRSAASVGGAQVSDLECSFSGIKRGLDHVAAILSGRMPQPEPRPVEIDTEPVQEIPRKVLMNMGIVSVRASSQAPSGSGQYAGRNALDGRPETWWGEGASGDGIGEWLEVGWQGRAEVREIRLISGYQKELRDRHGDRWYLNNRLRKVRVDVGGGGSITAMLEDRKGFQSIAIPPGNFGTSVRIVIMEVYPGYSSEGNRIQDSGISEIQVRALQ